jgi:hypothetical protein
MAWKSEYDRYGVCSVPMPRISKKVAARRQADESGLENDDHLIYIVMSQDNG